MDITSFLAIALEFTSMSNSKDVGLGLVLFCGCDK